MTIVLASSSPRRREILTTLRVPFAVDPSGADESRLAGEPARDYVVRVASSKTLDVLRRHAEGTFVLGADTIVELDGDILGKPGDDPAQGRALLARLAGRAHEVTTAVVLGRAGHGVLEAVRVTTRVFFRALGPDIIARYVELGEGRDKAGGYAVQGLASGWIERLEGSYSGVVGLPAAETVALLERHGAIEGWPR